MHKVITEFVTFTKPLAFIDIRYVAMHHKIVTKEINIL